MPAFVAGRPALFLTSTERAWRESVQAAALAPLTRPHLVFTVSSYRRGGQDFDIDNLAKPVLETIAPQPATIWVEVQLGEAEGVLVDDAPPPAPPRHDVLLDVALPRRRSVRPLIPLVETHGMSVLGELTSAVGIELHFDDAAERIGDFGFTGPIKPLIDALGNVLGTYVAGPCDYRIKELRVRRGGRPERAGVRVAMWLL